MSMFRKTVLTTAIIGAGLVSTTGAAFAGDCPDSGSKSHGHGHESSESGHHASGIGCANGTEAENNNGGEALGSVLGGDQAISSLNLCDNLNGNTILSNNNVALLGDIQNGDNTQITETKTSADSTGKNSAATVTPIPAA